MFSLRSDWLIITCGIVISNMKMKCGLRISKKSKEKFHFEQNRDFITLISSKPSKVTRPGIQGSPSGWTSKRRIILFLAKSLGDAYHQFTHDNKTEFPNEVNILERFNIYQEIVLGIIYRVFQPKLRPILWYAYSGMDLLFATTFYIFLRRV